MDITTIIEAAAALVAAVITAVVIPYIKRPGANTASIGRPDGLSG